MAGVQPIWNINAYESLVREYSRFNTSWTPGRPGQHPTSPVLGVRVQADGLVAGAGEVKVYEAGRLIGSAEVADGAASVPLDGFRGAGRRTLWVVYTGADDIAPSRTTYRTPPSR